MDNPICDKCEAFMIALLENRMRRILAVDREQNVDEENQIGEAQCFQLMEIQRILEGKQTCGVFDEYGPPAASATITGPLFQQPA